MKNSIAQPPQQQGQRQRHTLLSHDHELICLTYEEALKYGYEADYGHSPEGGYWVEVYACSLNDFSEILKGAEEQQKANGAQLNAAQLTLWNKREAA